MNVLIVGSGGREHAIAHTLSKSPKVKKLFCAPGNAGIGKITQRINVSAEDIDGIVKAAKEENIDFAVIGPEVPLAMGIVDALESAGIKTFGPNKKCAQLEASKKFTKEFLLRHNIPTAKYKEFTDQKELMSSIGIFGFPMVIKADGLAAGKGVVIAETEEEAKVAIQQMMGDKIFGKAGELIVVEEFLTGTEASVLCFVDEKTIVPMESARDYKRIFDNDEGPNTGGMGTYSPSPLFDETLNKRVMDEILAPTLKGFQKDGLDFKGVLFVGVMITEDGPKVIEFNNRFGDPETQSILPRLETDLMDILVAVTENKLSSIEIKWSDKRAVCVVLASGGYPGDYEKGCVINGLDDVDDDIMVFHAGTKAICSCGDASCDKEFGCTCENCTCELLETVTNGGRVLGVTTLADTHEKALEKVYANIPKISFEGMQYRKDIGR